MAQSKIFSALPPRALEVAWKNLLKNDSAEADVRPTWFFLTETKKSDLSMDMLA